jgi:hypothetical protein
VALYSSKFIASQETKMATASARTKSSNKHHSQNGNGRKAHDRVVEHIEDVADTAAEAAAAFTGAARRQAAEASNQLQRFFNAASSFAPGAVVKNIAEANVEVFELFSRQAGVLADWPSRIARIRSPEELFRAQTNLMQELVVDFQETSQRVWSNWAGAMTESARRTARTTTRLSEEHESTLRQFAGRQSDRVSGSRSHRT